MRAFDDFLPELAARRLDVELFYEVKANLKKAQVRLLRDAGVRVIQPGIESFSNDVLARMRKGVRGLQNIQLLKWCKEFGITRPMESAVGVPARATGRICAHGGPLAAAHAPDAATDRRAMRIDRFSPNFDRAEALEFADVQPFAAYRHIYPFEPAVVANLAYYFTYGYREPQDVERYTADVVREVRRWQQLHPESDLFSIDLGTVLLVCDLRGGGEALVTLSGLQRLLYELCDTACPLATLQQKTSEATSTAVSATELDALLEPLLDRGLMVREGMSYLSLAISVGEYSPGVAARRKLQRLLSPRRQLPAPRAPAIPCVSQNGPPLPGLDLAVIRGVTLSLREDASLVEVGENALAITGPHARFRMNALTPGLHAAWRRLASGGASEEELGDQVLATDGPVERALLRVQLRRCDTLGLLQYALVAGARPLAIFVPMRRGFHFSVELVSLDARFRLSRFAYCRRVEQVLMIESLLSAARTILPDGTGAALLAELATPRTCRDLCVRSRPTDRAELDEETAQALLTLLSGADVIAEADGDGRLREDLDPALVQWEFHDLLFHSRSRLGQHEYPFGGLFPFLGQIPPLPAVKPSISSEIVPLHKPDSALLEATGLVSQLRSGEPRVSSRVRYRAH